MRKMYPIDEIIWGIITWMVTAIIIFSLFPATDATRFGVAATCAIIASAAYRYSFQDYEVRTWRKSLVSFCVYVVVASSFMF